MRVNNIFATIILVFIITVLTTGCSQPASLNDLEEWDLVYISDNSEIGAQYQYAKFIEEDTGKTVTLHNYVISELSAQVVLDALRGETTNEQFSEKLKDLREAVIEAEVIVYFAGNYDDIEGMGGLTGDLMACFNYFACTPPDNCTSEVYQPYSIVVGEIFKEMLALRDGKPTIIRAMNFYNPYISGQQTCGDEMETACIQCWTTFNNAVRIAAENNRIPLVSVYDLFNGANYDEDPVEKGYIGGMGFFPSKEGAIAIAELLREAGYDPVEP